ncbi:MAG: hypothetical protein ABIB47_02625 [Candidatus Woesearchaeota archaeon]
MKRGLYLFFLLMSCQVVFSIGVIPSSYNLDFRPNLEETYQFKITDASQQLELKLEGDLSNFATLDKKTIVSGETFNVILKLPEEIDIPGKHSIFATATEVSGTGGNIAAMGRVKGLIIVNVPFQGKYINPPHLSISDTNVNEKTQTRIDVQSFGTEDIDELYGVIDVFDMEDNKLASSVTNVVSLASLQRVTLESEVDTTDLVAGEYKAKGLVFFDDQSQETNEALFKVGELNVKLNNYTKEVFTGQINKFDVTVESGWNNLIKSLFVEVRVFDEGSEVANFRTVPEKLDPWEIKTVTGFLDASDLDPANYDIELIVNYEGSTTVEKGSLLVKRREGEISPTLLVLIVVGVLIVLTNVYWFLKVKKKKTPRKGKKKKKSPYGLIFRK